MWQSQINQQASPDNCGTLNGFNASVAIHPTPRTGFATSASAPFMPSAIYHGLLLGSSASLLQAFCSRTSLQDLLEDFIQILCFKTSFRDLPQDLVQVFCSETSLLEDLPSLQELHPLNYCNRPGAETKIARPFTTQIISGTTIHYRDNCHRPVLQQNTKSLETKTRFQAGQK
ncbi:hypothetical protein B0H11DRAFT_2060089 [Mycena galericulata]|nr:hypothetical protein B0H11DRAFT_2060089 [Mycena galericulata]